MSGTMHRIATFYIHGRVRKALLLSLTVTVLGILIVLHTLPVRAADETGKSDVDIVLTNTGFKPQTVFITRGTRVTFKTEREDPFWPASDLHPFHTIYSAFDPKKPLSAEETWSFVFSRDGRWNYHDHIDPVVMGVIVVVPPGASANKRYDVLAPCDQASLSGRQGCWKEHIQFALQRNGLAAAFTEVSDIYRSDTEFARNCHLYVHDLGLLAYQRYGDSMPLISDTRTCGQGFYHGFMEGFLSKHGGDVIAASTFCRSVEEHHQEDLLLAGPQCYHGIGHGQMEYYLTTRLDLMNDLPRLVGLGVSDCGKLPNDDTRFRCASGAYAVVKDWINIQDLTAHYPDLFSLTDPYALCAYVEKDWEKRACAWELSKEVLILAKYDAKSAFAAELAAGRRWAPEYLPFMVRSTAFLIGEFGVARSDEELVQECSSISEQEPRTWCIEGIESGLLFNGSPDNEAPRSARFCASDMLNDIEQRTCVDTLLSYMQDAHSQSGLAKACSALFTHNLSSPLCR